VPQFIQSCNVKTMSKTRLNIRRQLILFERLESDKRLAVLYQALLEHKYAEQLELEEAESRDLTEEERQAQEAELLTGILKIRDCHFEFLQTEIVTR
jgi:hypothetical protein